jgi:beta-N-acetylhexosaminidase
VISGLLREELGFGGLVVTDALEMRAISETVGVRRAAVTAVAAGADALCVGRDLAGEEVVEDLAGALVEAVAAGRLPEARLAEAARRVRELGAWVQGGVDACVATGGRAAALEAARRAIRPEGQVEVGASPLVVELQAEPMVAVGDVPWGVGAAISFRDPGATVVRVDGPGQDVGSVLSAATGGPVVLAFRDLHRHAWQMAFADELTRRRPDVVLVEMGVPVSRPAGARAYLATHGASLVSAAAAAEVLLGASSS